MDGNMFDSLASLGIMNKISTGNSVLDMLLCMLLPIVLRHAPRLLKQAWQHFKRRPDSRPKALVVTRHLDCPHSLDSENDRAAERNHMLREALEVYIGSQPELIARLQEAELKVVELGTKQAGAEGGVDACNTDEQDYVYSSDCADLPQLQVTTAPPKDIEIAVADGVTFVRRTEVRGDKESPTKAYVTKVTLTSRRSDAVQRIDAFVAAAFAHYKRAKATEVKDTTRYFFTPASDWAKKDGRRKFRRYALSDDKTFARWFHADKAALLALVDRFLCKAGKFAIEGYPHKLGVLLHGPPGTGKTALIKALAHRTRRHIVSVPLDKIRSNQELMDIMYGDLYSIVDQKTVYMPPSKVVFVMEDIDAAGSVVLRRSVLDAMAQAEAARTALHGWGAMSAPQDGDAAEAPELPPVAPPPVRWLESNALTLAGLLNVLDGVVDCPGRIVVMTTNHPENLDPALIRPGRINKQLYLGFMRAPEACAMVRHHFPAASEAEVAEFGEALGDSTVGPAWLEALCAEHEELWGLTAHLRADGCGGVDTMGGPAAGSEVASEAEVVHVEAAVQPVALGGATQCKGSPLIASAAYPAQLGCAGGASSVSASSDDGSDLAFHLFD